MLFLTVKSILKGKMEPASVLLLSAPPWFNSHLQGSLLKIIYKERHFPSIQKYLLSVFPVPSTMPWVQSSSVPAFRKCAQSGILVRKVQPGGNILHLPRRLCLFHLLPCKRTEHFSHRTDHVQLFIHN